MPLSLADLLSAFRHAVQDELAHKRQSAPRSVIMLTDGRHEGRYGRHHRFLFRTSFVASPSLLDDSHGELHVNDDSYLCSIVSINADRVALALAHELYTPIPRARLIIDRSRLLEALLKRLAAIEAHPDAFLTSLALKCFDCTAIPTEVHDRVPSAETSLNPAQRAALVRALSQDFLFIWGPPGTGKTTVIGSLVHAAVPHQHRVLLCATTNAAVDQALDAVLQQGTIERLIRYGTPSVDASTAVTAHTLDTIASTHIQPLQAQVEVCNRTLAPLETEAEQLEQAFRLYEQYQEVEDDVQQAAELLRHLRAQLHSAWLPLRTSQTRVETLLAEARTIAHACFSWRWFFLRSATRVYHDLRQHHFVLKSQQHQVQVLLRQVDERTAQYKALTHKFDDLQRQLGTSSLSNTAKAHERLRTLESEIRSLHTRRTEYRHAIKEVKATLIRNSMVVATTLAQLYTTPLLDEERFDLVILDEASMASLPALFSALCVARRQVVLVGDFFQLPPIAESTSPVAQQWLARDIYTVAGIYRTGDRRVAALDTQYRMHPDIARIAQRLYRRAGLNYRTAADIRTARESATQIRPAPGNALVFVDTAAAHPRTERDSKSSAGNRYHAQLAIHIAHEALTTSPTLTIGIIAPYRHQVRLLQQLAHEAALDPKIRIGTIHHFQGQQTDVVIFDTTVTGDLTRTMLGRSDRASSPWKLVNVALTRAQGKLIIIGHRAALATLAHLPKALLWDCVQLSEKLGTTVSATEIIPAA